MTRNFTFILMMLLLSTLAYSQASIQGRVIEEDTGEGAISATIQLFKNGVYITGASTDFDGNYELTGLDPATYDIEVSYVGFANNRIEGIPVGSGKINKVDITLSKGVQLETAVIRGFKVPLVEFDNTTQGAQLTAENIEKIGTKNLAALASTTAGVTAASNGDISVRGSRPDATDFYIDGIRVNPEFAANAIPQADIEQLQVITGGIEAKYGDVTGGVISYTTKGPSSKYTAGLEAETSLDGYGYNLLNGNLSGPIIKDSTGRAILGFRLFGQYRTVKDDNPSAVGVNRAPREVIDALGANPVTTLSNGTSVATAELYTNEALTNDLGLNFDPYSRTRPNERDTDINLSGKLDAKISDNVDITLTGAYFDSENQFTPGRTTTGSWDMYNWVNNPFALREGYRGNIRLRHRLGNQNLDNEDKGVVRNAHYSLQFGYEYNQNSREDARHGDNLFAYGHYGNQAREWNPVLSRVTDPEWSQELYNGFAHQGYAMVDGEFTPGNSNAVLAQYNTINGFRDNTVNNVYSTIYDNVGQAYNLFEKAEQERYTLNVNSGFDLYLGSDDKAKHSVQFGFIYEQRTEREYSINPRQLWTIMRQQVNRHLTSVDTANWDGSRMELSDPVTGLTVPNAQVFQPLNEEELFETSVFFRRVRAITGDATGEYTNIDALDPSQLSLDLFSAQDLTDFPSIGLDYHGYNYLGEKLTTNPGFNDFFTDESRSFDVPAFEPIYGAAYIQDKFQFKDIIIRAGVRIDYYDANTKVLKDPYSFTEIKTATEFHGNPDTEAQPGAVGDDYFVYVNGEESTEVVGYRQGETWYDPSGVAIDPSIIFGTRPVTPAFVQEDFESRNPQSNSYDPNISFKDYDPQLNVMPRIALSFPISDDAGFFAHYDVLVQRPPSNIYSSPLDYYYINNVSNRFNASGVPANNPDLRPERTTDFEVGFHQKLTNSSAIKISLYRKNLDNMIQRRFYPFVHTPITRYETFGNLDFGSVNGYTLTYDLRRTNNLEFKVAYTLQFAAGSGSDANSSSGLNSNGIIRDVFAFSNDERHRFSIITDYRFGSGIEYNGPTIKGKEILSNFGMNLLTTLVSGRPYSEFSDVRGPFRADGRLNINGGRKPWIFNMDLQVDKSFKLKFSEDSKRSLGVNVYLRITNLLDRDNVNDVYGHTGDPDTDGFLATQLGQTRLGLIDDNRGNTDSYLSHYEWALIDQGNYLNPRQIYLGALFNF